MVDWYKKTRLSLYGPSSGRTGVACDLDIQHLHCHQSLYSQQITLTRILLHSSNPVLSLLLREHHSLSSILLPKKTFFGTPFQPSEPREFTPSHPCDWSFLNFPFPVMNDPPTRIRVTLMWYNVLSGTGLSLNSSYVLPTGVLGSWLAFKHVPLPHSFKFVKKKSLLLVALFPSYIERLLYLFSACSAHRCYPQVHSRCSYLLGLTTSNTLGLQRKSLL
jgi:hypothetical protein